jgi:hypothetical protein
VRARPDRVTYRARKFLARYRWQLGADAELKTAPREDPELRADWLRTRARYLMKTGDMPEHDRLRQVSGTMSRRVRPLSPRTLRAGARTRPSKVAADSPLPASFGKPSGKLPDRFRLCSNLRE